MPINFARASTAYLRFVIIVVDTDTLDIVIVGIAIRCRAIVAQQLYTLAAFKGIVRDLCNGCGNEDAVQIFAASKDSAAYAYNAFGNGYLNHGFILREGILADGCDCGFLDLRRNRYEQFSAGVACDRQTAVLVHLVLKVGVLADKLLRQYRYRQCADKHEDRQKQ